MTLTDSEIIEYNELIAEFMEFKQKQYTPTSEKLWCDNKHGLPVGELKFHESWDWLIPVWHKFSDLERPLQPRHKAMWEWYYSKIKSELLGNNTPNQAFLRLVDAIEWYNATKQELLS